MQFTHTLALAALLGASTINAHLALTWPLPFRASYNPNSVQADIDYSITTPLAADGSNFPCKYNDMGTAGGKSVVTWQAGATANWTVGTGAVHGGGSCQVALSYDSGKTFRVIHSYIGDCPAAVSSSADFTVPADAPAGNAMFAWTWQNEVGNREFYMSCASVTIEAGSGSKRDAPAVAFDSRPDLFLINLNNGCTSVESTAVNYPDPGPDADVTRKTSDTGSFTGTCGPVNGVATSGSAGEASSSNSTTGSSSSSAPAGSSSAAGGSPSTYSAPASAASSVGSSSTPVSITIIPSPSSAATSATASSPIASSSSIQSSSIAATQSSSASTPSSSGTSSGSLTVSPDGQCGGDKTCAGSIFGSCCSKWGFCGGPGDAWCGTGCQPGFGTCGTYTNTSSSSVGAAVPSAQASSSSMASVPSSSAALSASVPAAASSAASAAPSAFITSPSGASVETITQSPSFKPTITVATSDIATPTDDVSVVVVTATVNARKRMIRGMKWQA